jgi:hypothetical protein
MKKPPITKKSAPSNPKPKRVEKNNKLVKKSPLSNFKKSKQKVGKFLPYLSFRFFCTAARDYIQDYKYSGRVDELFESDYNFLIPEQCTGLKDKDKKWVFEGDILEIKVKDIDSSIIKIMDESIKGLQSEKKGKRNPTLNSLGSTGHLRVCVERDPCEPCNLTLELSSQTNPALTTYLPLSYIKKAKVIDKRLQQAPKE